MPGDGEFDSGFYVRGGVSAELPIYCLDKENPTKFQLLSDASCKFILQKTHSTDPSFFDDVRDHHHDCTILLPNHAPKIIDRVGQRSCKEKEPRSRTDLKVPTRFATE